VLLLLLASSSGVARAADNQRLLLSANGTRAGQPITTTVLVYLPVALKDWPPKAGVPALQPVGNSDLNNAYSVIWGAAANATNYRLQEATNPDFNNVVTIYNGPALSFSLVGKMPGTYYYRVQSANAWGVSDWSNSQSVRIYPLFVGLSVRWDGVGYLRGSSSFYEDNGTHETRLIDLLTDADTGRVNSRLWYDPNPSGWPEDTWYAYYSLTTGAWRSNSSPGDPSWKWGYAWFLGYDSQPANGQVWTIGGQPFAVSGPHAGYTSYGRAVQYWQFVNQSSFLFYDDGSDWVQYVHPGEAILWYDAGNSHLVLHSNVKRHYYYQGQLSQYTVQYIDSLSSTNALPAGVGALAQRERRYPEAVDDCGSCVPAPIAPPDGGGRGPAPVAGPR
jgi:hypothetical protein